jgi:hypothetical protein
MTGDGATRGYWREISAVLLLKILAITILYALFFAPGNRPGLTAETVAGHIQQIGSLK